MIQVTCVLLRRKKMKRLVSKTQVKDPSPNKCLKKQSGVDTLLFQDCDYSKSSYFFFVKDLWLEFEEQPAYQASQ